MKPRRSDETLGISRADEQTATPAITNKDGGKSTATAASDEPWCIPLVRAAEVELFPSLKLTRPRLMGLARCEEQGHLHVLRSTHDCTFACSLIFWKIHQFGLEFSDSVVHSLILYTDITGSNCYTLNRSKEING